MKKRFKILLGLVFVFAVLGFGIYYYGTKMLSDKVIDQVAMQLEKSGEVEKIKQQINSNPELQKFVSEGANVDSSTLPFETKEEAMRKLVKKFNVSELKEIQTSVQGGLTAEKKRELLNSLESKLTQEEIMALKVLAYKELNKQ